MPRRQQRLPRTPTCVIVTSARTRHVNQKVDCKKRLWYAVGCNCNTTDSVPSHHYICAEFCSHREHLKTTMPSTKLAGMHRLPSNIRQIIVRNANYTTQARVAIRQLSHVATRPRLNALAATHLSQQQQRSITIEQLDSGRDSKSLQSYT